MTPAEEQIAYFYWLGRSLAGWARVESRIFDAAARCFPAETRPPLGMGFAKIQGFRNKLLFADGAITRKFHGTHVQEEWADLFETISSTSGKRNNLAHYQTGEFPDNEAGRRWALCPWYAKKGRDKTKPPEGAFCVVDLVILESEFAALEAKVANFVARALDEKEPFLKSDEQPGSPLTIPQIARQIHAELGHPQKSSREKRREADELNSASSLLVELANEVHKAVEAKNAGTDKTNDTVTG